MSNRPLLLLAMILGLGAASCTERVEINNVLVSPEKQREDLMRARDMGIISEQEFLQEVSEIGKTK